MKIITTAAAGSPEWAAAHAGKIGGSMAADILGCGRKTRKHAYAVLTGKLVEDLSKLPYVRLGVALEPVIKRLWETSLSRTLHDSPGLLEHPTVPYIVGTPDGIDAATGGVFEAKSVGFHRQFEWRKGTPLRTQVQGQWYSMLIGNPGPIFCAAMALPDGREVKTGDGDDSDGDDSELLLGSDAEPDDLLLYAQQDPDPKFQERAVNEVVDFYEKYIRKDIEPPAVDQRDLPLIKKLHPVDDKSSRVASPAMVEKIMEWKRVRQEKNLLQKRVKLLEVAIRDEQRDTTWLVGPVDPETGKPLWFLRNTTEPRPGHTVKPSAPRKLILMKEQRYA